jgi:hypothetical protein
MGFKIYGEDKNELLTMAYDHAMATNGITHTGGCFTKTVVL